jgi:transposase
MGHLQYQLDPPANRKRPRRVGILLVGVGLGVLLATLFLHVAFSERTAWWNRLASNLTGYLTGRTTTIDTSSMSVVEKVRRLSRLETVVYSIDKVVEGQRENVLLPSFLAGDKLLLIAHGEVIAGIDMAQLKSADITVSGDSVRVHLPAPQILATRLDNQHTRVYSRTTGLLVAADPNLESQVRQAAEQQITQAAISDGILDKARQNAQASVTTLLYGLGFHQVQVS